MAFNFTEGNRQTIALLSKSGRFWIRPQTCKSYILDALSACFYPEYTELWSIWNPDSGLAKPTKKLNLDRPEFVIWTGTKSAENNAEKFCRFINRLEDMAGVDGRTTVIVPDMGKSKNAAPFIARAPKFWIKTPITASAYLLFLRLAIRLKKRESWTRFLDRMMDKKECPYPDAGYIRLAVRRGNIKGLLEQSLPCLHREGYSDYLLHNHGRGFAWYHPESDGILPSDEKSLKILRLDGRKAELNRMDNKEV